MSWGSGGSAATAGSGAATAGSGAATAGSGAATAGSGAATAGSGFSLDTGSTANTAAQPTFMESMSGYLDKFQKGRDAKMGDAWDGRGVNPETAGYVYGKAGQLASMSGGGKGAAPITMNISNQQPENSYLRKRGY